MVLFRARSRAGRPTRRMRAGVNTRRAGLLRVAREPTWSLDQLVGVGCIAPGVMGFRGRGIASGASSRNAASVCSFPQTLWPWCQHQTQIAQALERLVVQFADRRSGCELSAELQARRWLKGRGARARAAQSAPSLARRLAAGTDVSPTPRDRKSTRLN